MLLMQLSDSLQHHKLPRSISDTPYSKVVQGRYYLLPRKTLVW